MTIICKFMRLRRRHAVIMKKLKGLIPLIGNTTTNTIHNEILPTHYCNRVTDYDSNQYPAKVQGHHCRVEIIINRNWYRARCYTT